MRGSLKKSVLEDMQILRETPFLKKETKVVGFLYDIRTGMLEEVDNGKESK